mmetsp:Transcript_24097/g.36463  ORF Transcript_24097/g.36463 Transcript_24097/m.36463 type:complete len:207 (+) Transcript_24097:158-778(+)
MRDARAERGRGWQGQQLRSEKLRWVGGPEAADTFELCWLAVDLPPSSQVKTKLLLCEFDLGEAFSLATSFYLGSAVVAVAAAAALALAVGCFEKLHKRGGGFLSGGEVFGVLVSVVVLDDVGLLGQICVVEGLEDHGVCLQHFLVLGEIGLKTPDPVREGQFAVCDELFNESLLSLDALGGQGTVGEKRSDDEIHAKLVVEDLGDL